MSAARLTLEDVARELLATPRWLNEWLRKHPADKAGEPYFTPVGRDKVFHQYDVKRIADQIDLDRRQASHVYFVEVSGHIKIGVTSNWKKRLSTLQTASPLRIRRLLVIRTGVGMEPIIHEKLADFRVRGEWFKDCPEVREFIRLASEVGLTVAGEEAA